MYAATLTTHKCVKYGVPAMNPIWADVPVKPYQRWREAQPTPTFPARRARAVTVL